MPQQTLSQARAGINPVLTNIAQGLRQNDLIGYELFPRVDVGQRAGKVITFGKEHFMQYSDLARSPGSATKRVQVGYSGAEFNLVDYAIEGSLPLELQEEQLSPDKGFTIDGAQMALMAANDILDLRLEIAQAQLAQDPNQYDATNKINLNGTSQWSDYSGTSNPFKVIETAKEAIRTQTGKRPNVGVMGATVLAQLKYHPTVINRMVPTGRDVPTLDDLAQFFGLERVVVGDAIVSNDAGTVMSDVWGKHMILAYTKTDTLANRGAPTFGYTYNLRGYPAARDAYYGNNNQTWYFPYAASEAPVIAAKAAGYLIQNAVA
jgi:hypothetical protein